MAQALDLARRGEGFTYPNPVVGCVIVRDGAVVGRGFHPKAGEPHAEVFALRAAGQAAAGATAYVTLEPCNHYGRTAPCSLALVEAAVARVRYPPCYPPCSSPEYVQQAFAWCVSLSHKTCCGISWTCGACLPGNCCCSACCVSSGLDVRDQFSLRRWLWALWTRIRLLEARAWKHWRRQGSMLTLAVWSVSAGTSMPSSCSESRDEKAGKGRGKCCIPRIVMRR